VSAGAATFVGMKLPTLRATEATGDSWDDPDADKLRDLIRELTPDNRFLVVERHDRISLWQHYMQVYLNDDASYDIEFREGGPQTHFRVQHTKADEAADVLVRWATDEKGWREALAWQRWDPAEGT
jgi:hypothetical protein